MHRTDDREQVFSIESTRGGGERDVAHVNAGDPDLHRAGCVCRSTGNAARLNRLPENVACRPR
jgi:hypothetical protein